MRLQLTSTFRQMQMPNAGTNAIRCRPDNEKLVTVARCVSRVRLFRCETGKQLAMFDLHRQQVKTIDVAYDNQQMV
ncbi:unnamed protein product [Didymodactylos carnosus]|uniref:Uncharacterized protein n=1 Tax=Didymodactylos carnosus TaxID=1234261 RepID=A0A8S2FBI7_9BILA|nr:unnamed protein product [Didymodactylos carnosus]CAF4216232.1 unnamed protein product [Didymodactylos carnosus]